MKIVDLVQNSPEWLAWRKNKIGASDCAAILGVSPWCSALQLWERKLGIAPEQTENFAMSRGKELEQQARRTLEEGKGKLLPPAIVQHPKYEWMIASLDGLSEFQHYAVEIKCPGQKDHELALNGIVPEKYIPQLQHQLEVTGLDMIYYYSFDGKQNACIEVYRDQAYIDKMMVELKKFHKCLVTCTPPELSEKDYNIRNDQEWENATQYWKLALQDLQTAQEEVARCRENLIKVSKSQNSKGYGVKVQKIMRQGCVDFSAIPVLQLVDLEQYRKPPSVSWRITVDAE